MKPEQYVKEDECPHCYHEVDCATLGRDTNHRPKPGDFSLCVYCCGIMRLDNNMNLYAPSEDEITHCDIMDDLRKMQKAIRTFKQNFPGLMEKTTTNPPRT